jgi:hypothetical protein
MGPPSSHPTSSVVVVLLSLALLHTSYASVVLTVNSTTVVNKDWVLVSFSGVPEENRDDAWVGLFPMTDSVEVVTEKVGFPWSDPYVNPAVIKYNLCSDSLNPDYKSTGNGSLNLIVHNLRQDLTLWLILDSTKSQKWTHSAIRGPTLTMLNQKHPMQGRIARTSHLSEMRVSWTSAVADEAAMVRWGPTTSLGNIATAKSSTYTQDDLCGAPAKTVGWIDPGTQYTAVLTGLKPSTTYYYQYGSNTTNATTDAFFDGTESSSEFGQTSWSEIHSFMSAPAPDPNQQQVIHIIADVGVSQKDDWKYHWAEKNAHWTIDGVRHTQNHSAPEILLHIGDIAYGTGYLAKWDEFMHSIQPVATSLPYMTGMGNHERDYPDSGSVIGTTDSGGECGVPTAARFIMPGESTPDNYWYSIDQGNVHIVMINTELDVSTHSDQYKFIDDDLKHVNRSVTPWVIFCGHRPMYSGNLDPPRDPHFADSLEPLLKKYKVDMAFWGHVHAAELTWPVYNSERIPVSTDGSYDAPVHAVIGNGGQTLTVAAHWDHKWMRWLPKAQYYGYSKLVALNATHMTFTMYRDDTDAVEESITIVRKFPRDY